MWDARRLLADKKPAEARTAAEAAIRADPTWAAPHQVNAEALQQSSHFRQAYEELLAAYRLAPNDAQAALAVLRVQGYAAPGELEPIARKAIALAPLDPEAHYHLGLTLVMAADPKRYAEAMTEFQESLRLAPDGIYPLIETGKLYSMQGDNRHAAAALEKAVVRLNGEMGHGTMTIDKLETWLQLQRTATFWLAQVTRRLNDPAGARRAAVMTARLSATTAMLRTLKDRAAATPPDLEARRRLRDLLQTGRVE